LNQLEDKANMTSQQLTEVRFGFLILMRQVQLLMRRWLAETPRINISILLSLFAGANCRVQGGIFGMLSTVSGAMAVFQGKETVLHIPSLCAKDNISINTAL
jgi:hypothetical protein